MNPQLPESKEAPKTAKQSFHFPYAGVTVEAGSLKEAEELVVKKGTN